MNIIMKKHAPGGSPVLVGLLAIVLMAAAPHLFAQEPDPTDDFLLGAYLKAQNLVDKTAADLLKVKKDIEADNSLIAKLENIQGRARQAGNAQAGSAASQQLQKARAAKEKNEGAMLAIERRLTKAEAVRDSIRDKRAVLSRTAGPKPQARGLVSDFSGEVRVLKKSGQALADASAGPALLEVGEAISTGRNGRAEIQVLDGRASVKLAGNSEVKLREDSPEKQVVELVKGKIYSAVDKPAEFEKMLLDKAGELNDAYERFILRIRARVQKKLELRHRNGTGSIRGTKFSVEVRNGGETEFAVFEGAVDISDPKGQETILVEQGFKVVVTKDGLSGPMKIGEADRWWDRD